MGWKKFDGVEVLEMALEAGGWSILRMILRRQSEEALIKGMGRGFCGHMGILGPKKGNGEAMWAVCEDFERWSVGQGIRFRDV